MAGREVGLDGDERIYKLTQAACDSVHWRKHRRQPMYGNRTGLLLWVGNLGRSCDGLVRINTETVCARYVARYSIKQLKQYSNRIQRLKYNFQGEGTVKLSGPPSSFPGPQKKHEFTEAVNVGVLRVFFTCAALLCYNVW